LDGVPRVKDQKENPPRSPMGGGERGLTNGGVGVVYNYTGEGGGVLEQNDAAREKRAKRGC